MLHAPVTTTVWVAIGIMTVSLIIRLFFYAVSPIYRAAIGNSLVPYPLAYPLVYHRIQPMPDVARFNMFSRLSPSLASIATHILGLASALYLLWGMECSFTGKCEAYAWSYVVFVGFMAVFIICSMLYDYVKWRRSRPPPRPTPRHM